jgi:hypothetical protein
VCNVGERREEHADARDVSEGVRTLGVLQARGGDKMDVLSADQDNSSSQTFQTGAAGIKSCSHGAIARGLEARWAITTGSAPINNQQGYVATSSPSLCSCSSRPLPSPFSCSRDLNKQCGWSL